MLNNKFNDKRKLGQVSVFIIVGIILVIVTLFLFFNNKIDLFQSHDTKLKNQISQVVKDCIYDSGNRGAFLLGFQGGYIDIPDVISADPRKYTDFGLLIPNWDSERGDIPTISSMESELSNFVSTESLSCIKSNLKEMETAFDIDIDDKFGVDLRINDENIVIESELLIRFNEKNSQEIFSVNDYYVKLDDLRLGDLYNLAVEIYNVEANDYVFEDLTIDQMRSADDYSSKNSMPTEGMSFSCAKKIWTIPQLKSNLANMNNNNFKYLNFIGTYSKDDLFDLNFNDELGTSQYRAYFDKQYVYNLQNPKSSYKNYNVEVMMPSTQITGKTGILQSYPFRIFEVTPSSGQIVKSMDMDIDVGTKIPIPCIQIFHHLYELDYDLIVKLTDMNDDGDRFVFQFPSRVEIKANTPKVKPASFVQQEPMTVNNDNYCAEDSKQYPMMVLAYDLDDNPVSDVDITYKCLSLKCDMGTTEKPKFMGVTRKYAPAELTTEFPFCIGGKVIGEKEGYHVAKQRVTTDESLFRRETFFGDNLVELVMIPKKTFDVIDETFLIKSRQTDLGKRVIAESDGSIYISIENKGYDFSSEAILPNEEGILDKIEFLDKEDTAYNLSIIYVDPSGDLKGIYELENWVPEIHSGNRVQFLIPGTDYKIEEDNYVEFYDYVKEKAQEDVYQPKFY